jgi:hypothetical protein
MVDVAALRFLFSTEVSSTLAVYILLKENKATTTENLLKYLLRVLQ